MKCQQLLKMTESSFGKKIYWRTLKFLVWLKSYVKCRRRRGLGPTLASHQGTIKRFWHHRLYQSWPDEQICSDVSGGRLFERVCNSVCVRVWWAVWKTDNRRVCQLQLKPKEKNVCGLCLLFEQVRFVRTNGRNMFELVLKEETGRSLFPSDHWSLSVFIKANYHRNVFGYWLLCWTIRTNTYIYCICMMIFICILCRHAAQSA